MRKIYQAATQTIVYLGEARDNCEEFLEAAEDFKAFISQKQWKAADNEAEICYFILRKDNVEEGVVLPQLLMSTVRAFLQFVAREWFTRVWTIQEFGVSEKVVSVADGLHVLGIAHGSYSGRFNIECIGTTSCLRVVVGKGGWSGDIAEAP